jgi:hypothetical protein
MDGIMAVIPFHRGSNVVTFAISTFMFLVTILPMMLLLTTLEKCFRAFTICLTMTKLLSFKATQWIWYKQNLHLYLVKPDFDIFGSIGIPNDKRKVLVGSSFHFSL